MINRILLSPCLLLGILKEKSQGNTEFPITNVTKLLPSVQLSNFSAKMKPHTEIHFWLSWPFPPASKHGRVGLGISW